MSTAIRFGPQTKKSQPGRKGRLRAAVTTMDDQFVITFPVYAIVHKGEIAGGVTICSDPVRLGFTYNDEVFDCLPVFTDKPQVEAFATSEGIGFPSRIIVLRDKQHFIAFLQGIVQETVKHIVLDPIGRRIRFPWVWPVTDLLNELSRD